MFTFFFLECCDFEWWDCEDCAAVKRSEQRVQLLFEGSIEGVDVVFCLCILTKMRSDLLRSLSRHPNMLGRGWPVALSLAECRRRNDACYATGPNSSALASWESDRAVLSLPWSPQCANGLYWLCPPPRSGAPCHNPPSLAHRANHRSAGSCTAGQIHKGLPGLFDGHLTAVATGGWWRGRASHQLWGIRNKWERLCKYFVCIYLCMYVCRVRNMWKGSFWSLTLFTANPSPHCKQRSTQYLQEQIKSFVTKAFDPSNVGLSYWTLIVLQTIRLHTWVWNASWNSRFPGSLLCL